MSKATINDVGNLIDATSARSTINANNDAIRTAFDNTLSRDGTSPNTMESELDMNSFQVLNLPQPATADSPLRLQDLSDFIGGGTVTNIPSGGTAGQSLVKASNTNYDTQWANTLLGVNNVDGSITANTVSGTTTVSVNTAHPNTWTGQQTFVAPALGTPASGTLTNATGLPITTGVSGLGSNVATFLATPSSANLASALTDETGVGANVFAQSPQLITPLLGTPTSGTLTNCTGLPLTTGVIGDLPYSSLAQGSARSVLGVAGNAIADVASIQGTSGQILGVPAAGTSVAFTSTPVLGTSGTAGTLGFAGSTSGTATITSQATQGAPALTLPTASGTFVTTASAPLAVNATSGAVSLTGAAGQVLAGSTPAFTATPTLGVAGSTVGTLGFQNATSGTLTVSPSIGALGSNTISLPIATDTLVGKATVDTLTNKTYDTAGTGNSFSINGVAANANTGTGAVVRATTPTLTTPNLGTPNSGTLTSCTGLPITTGVSGLAANVATFLATPSSANLASAMTDETGTGANVFANTPTLVTPVLGTPNSGTLTNCTGLPLSGLTTQGAYTLVGNNTGSTAVPTAVDIALLTTKASPAAGDYAIISDQAASGAWKKATVSSLASAGSVSSIAGNTGAFTLTNGVTNSTNAIQLSGNFTSTSANAWAVGPAGTTNPSLNVDASTASAATGLNIKSAAAAGGLAVSTISSGANENLTIDAKGSGTLALNNTATGIVTTPRTLKLNRAQDALWINASASIVGEQFTNVFAGNTLRGIASNDSTNTNGANHFYFAANGANVGNITTTAGTTTVYGTTSDSRLKSEREEIKNPRALIESIKPVEFTWDSSGNRDIGFIAQEVSEALPLMAVQIGDNNPDLRQGDEGFEQWGLDYSKFTPYLWAALQDAYKKIDKLEERVTALEQGN